MPEKTGSLRIRLGHPGDARAIGLLVRRVARRWVLPDQPVRAGRAMMARFSAAGFRERILMGQRFHLAFLGSVLVGVAGMRDDCHLVQLFVGTRYQGRGIARRLWQRTMSDAIRRAGTRRFTLNASRCAVPVYLHLGFVPTGPEGRSPMGVISTPMALVRRRARARVPAA